MSSTTDRFHTIAACALVVTAAFSLPMEACAQAGANAQTAQKPAALQQAYRQLQEGGQRDAVLNYMEIATLALKLGDYSEAAQAIDQALLNIEQYYGLTREALQARSLWYEEGSKAFKGEPYERAMAHYYRGMLDLRLGDYDNARASFASGSLQDAFAEEEQYQSDFALLVFLSAWSATLSGAHSLAEESYAELLKLRPDFERPPADHDTLVIIETGKSPRKLADGVGHSELVYRRDKKQKEQSVKLNIGYPVPAFRMEDIFFQASTRGGRQVDRILAGKIQFRNDNARMGSALADAGMAFNDIALATNDNSYGNIAGGLSVLGSMQLMVAQSARPRPDTRYWSGLPDGVHVYTYASSEYGAGPVGIEYFSAEGLPLPDLTQTVSRLETGKGAGLVWAVSQN